MRLLGFYFTLAFLVSPFASASASSQLLGCTDSGLIINVDTATGASSNPRPTGFSNLSGLVFDSLGTLYGLINWNNINYANSLIRINPVTGAGTYLGGYALSIPTGDLALSPIDGHLYGTEHVILVPQPSLQLFRIDPVTHDDVIVGTISTLTSNYPALAFNAAGVLFAINVTSTNAVLVTLSPLTGAILSSVTMNLHLSGDAGLVFDPATGIAYLVGNPGTGSNLYTLDINTGVATSVGALGLNDVTGLTFAPVPEPSSLWLVYVGSVILLASVTTRRLFRTP